jgi:ribosome-binding factor A
MRDGHLEETLRRLLAEALANEVQDPRVGFVTVSEVRLNKDNSVATVFYTVMGDDEAAARTLAGLKSSRGFLRQRIGDQVRLRVVPELRFRYDESLDRSFKVEEILENLDDVADPDPGGSGNEDR